MTTYNWNYGSVGSGLQFSISYDTATGKFGVTCTQGSFDLNAIWWGDDVADGFSPTGYPNSLNMNGSNVLWDETGGSTTQSFDWDSYQVLSTAGLGTAGVDKTTYITQGETVYFDASAAFKAFLTAQGDNADDINLGVRATSTSTAGGSIKWVDDDATVGNDPPPDDFPTWPQDISHTVLYFEQTEGDTKPDGGDGYYLIKIDNVPGSADQDFDTWIGDVLTYLEANDPNFTSADNLVGVAIKGGTQTTQFYAYGDYNTNGTASDPIPTGAPDFATPPPQGDVPGPEIDKTYDYGDVYA